LVGAKAYFPADQMAIIAYERLSQATFGGGQDERPKSAVRSRTPNLRTIVHFQEGVADRSIATRPPQMGFAQSSNCMRRMSDGPAHRYLSQRK
jgi:hypothetical protein